MLQCSNCNPFMLRCNIKLRGSAPGSALSACTTPRPRVPAASFAPLAKAERQQLKALLAKLLAD